MKTRAIVTLFALLVFGVATAQAADEFTVDPLEINLGFMNVFELDGGYVYGEPWTPADLTATYDSGVLTLGPNSIGDPNEFWYQCVDPADAPNCGGPGAPGNKLMEANMYAQVDNGLAGVPVTFSGIVLSNTLTDAHTVIAFVKDFAPDFSSFVESSVPLTAEGPFTVTLTTTAAPDRHVQWGFQMVGPNVWITDVGQFGTMELGADPAVPEESTSWGAVKSLYR